MNNNLTVSGATNLNNNLTVSSKTELNNLLTIKNNGNIWQFNSQGIQFGKEGALMEAAISVNDSAGIVVSSSGGLAVSELTTLNNGLKVLGNTEIVGKSSELTPLAVDLSIPSDPTVPSDPVEPIGASPSLIVKGYAIPKLDGIDDQQTKYTTAIETYGDIKINGNININGGTLNGRLCIESYVDLDVLNDDTRKSIYFNYLGTANTLLGETYHVYSPKYPFYSIISRTDIPSNVIIVFDKKIYDKSTALTLYGAKNFLIMQNRVKEGGIIIPYNVAGMHVVWLDRDSVQITVDNHNYNVLPILDHVNLNYSS